MTNKKVFSLIDRDTGVIYEDVTRMITTKQDSYFKERKEMIDNEMADKYGNFIFKVHSKTSSKLENELTSLEIFKLAYISTYINYNGVLLFNDKKKMKKDDIKMLIGGSENSFYKWYNILIKKKVLIEYSNHIKVSSKYYLKGRISKNKDYTLLFINPIRELFENNSKKSVSVIGDILRMTEYIHRSNNIIAWNYDEINEEFLGKITIKEIVELLGRNKNNIKRFVESLKTHKIYGEPLVKIYSNNGEKNISSHNMVINPLFACKTNMLLLEEISKNFIEIN